MQDELSLRNDDVISVGAASFSTINHDRSMTTLNPDRELNLNRTPVPGGSRRSNRSKYSNASRSVKGEGSSVNNVLLDDYGKAELQPFQKPRYKHRTTNKKNMHSKKRSLATLPVKDLVREFDVPREGEDAVSANDTQSVGKRS